MLADAPVACAPRHGWGPARSVAAGWWPSCTLGPGAHAGADLAARHSKHAWCPWPCTAVFYGPQPFCVVVCAQHPNRAAERRPEIIEVLRGRGYQAMYDMSVEEGTKRYFEGTGGRWAGS